MVSFLLIGQSNMAGRGFLEEAQPIDESRIYILRNGRWQKLFRPINPDRSFSGVSLAESFAERYAREHDTDVGLICCADGGTSLEQWMPGSLLYDHAVFNARLAMRTSNLAGVLWHQGESDCAERRYPVYREKLLEMMNTLRKDLGCGDLPLLLGGLGDYLREYEKEGSQIPVNYPRINEALKAAAAELPNAGFVSAGGLGSNPDHLHFSADALYEFGLRYYAEFEKLDQTTHQPQAAEDLIRSELEQL